MTHISTLLICILNVSWHCYVERIGASNQGAGHTRHNKIWNESVVSWILNAILKVVSSLLNVLLEVIRSC